MASRGGRQSPRRLVLTPLTAEPFASIDICKINFEAPDYLSTALKIHAARERTSVRHVILKALKEGGFEICNSEMVEDGRRQRGSSRLK